MQTFNSYFSSKRICHKTPQLNVKLFLTNQKSNFQKHLTFLKAIPVMEYEVKKLKEKISTIAIHSSKSIDELDLDFLFNYELFPEHIISVYSQWNDEKSKMAIGDTIVQQATIPPIQWFSQKIIIGVRIKELFYSPDRKGFSYETLAGHVEKGISTFTVEEVNSQLMFKIHTFSKPGSFLSKLVGLLFSVPYQTFCTKKCLNNVKEQLEKQ